MSWHTVAQIAVLMIQQSGGSPRPSMQSIQANDWRPIAEVGGTDRITQVHVENLLKRSGIDSYSEGSLAYGVFVQTADAATATRILHDDAHQRRFAISFTDKSSIAAAAGGYIEYAHGEAVAAFRRRSAKQLPLALRGFLSNRAIADRLSRFHVVASFRARRRDCMLPDGRIGDAFELVIKLEARDWTGYEVDYEVLPGGNTFQYLGGAGFGESPLIWPTQRG